MYFDCTGFGVDTRIAARTESRFRYTQKGLCRAGVAPAEAPPAEKPARKRIVTSRMIETDRGSRACTATNRRRACSLRKQSAPSRQPAWRMRHKHKRAVHAFRVRHAAWKGSQTARCPRSSRDMQLDGYGFEKRSPLQRKRRRPLPHSALPHRQSFACSQAPPGAPPRCTLPFPRLTERCFKQQQCRRRRAGVLSIPFVAAHRSRIPACARIQAALFA